MFVLLCRVCVIAVAVAVRAAHGVSSLLFISQLLHVKRLWLLYFKKFICKMWKAKLVWMCTVPDCSVKPRKCHRPGLLFNTRFLLSVLSSFLQHRASAVISKRVRYAAASWFLQSSVARLSTPALRIACFAWLMTRQIQLFSPIVLKLLKVTERFCLISTLRTQINWVLFQLCVFQPDCSV